jgi:uncharacterized membrane protein YdfJ with MMPL/SSD domain
VLARLLEGAGDVLGVLPLVVPALALSLGDRFWRPRNVTAKVSV